MAGRSVVRDDATAAVTSSHTSPSSAGSRCSDARLSRIGAVNCESSRGRRASSSTAAVCCPSTTRSGRTSTSSRLSGGSATSRISSSVSSSAAPSTTVSSQRNCDSTSLASGMPACAGAEPPSSSSWCSCSDCSSCCASTVCTDEHCSSRRTTLSLTASPSDPPVVAARVGCNARRKADGSAHVSRSDSSSSSCAPGRRMARSMAILKENVSPSA